MSLLILKHLSRAYFSVVFLFKRVACQKNLLWEDGNTLLCCMKNTLIGRPSLVKTDKTPDKLHKDAFTSYP